MQRGKTVLLLGLIVVCGWLGAGSAYAAVYYVAKTGLDGNPGTEAQPWLTIQKAAATMSAGDTAYVRSGTYNEQVTPVNSGNAGAWITLKAFPGDKVVIDGTGLEFTVQGLIQINGGIAYWDIEGFELANSAWAGVQFYVNSNHHVLKDLTIHDSQISGIYAGGSSNLTIDGCEVYHTNISGSQETITMSEVHNFEVRNCIVRNTLGVDSPVGVQKEGIDCKDGSANGLIHHNEIYDTQAGVYVDTYADGTANIAIYSNYIHDCPNGIVQASETGQDVSDISIYNNVVRDCSARAIGIEAFTLVDKTPVFTRIRIFNNTVYCDTAGGFLVVGAVHYGELRGFRLVDCAVVNNIVDTHLRTSPHFSLFTYGFSGPELTVDHNLVYTNENESELAAGTNYVLADPKFRDPAHRDFRLQSNSPAIDAATAVNAPATDSNGIARPQGAGYDIGAYEYQAAAPAEYSISGCVKDCRGGAISGVTMTLTGSTALSTTTDAGGLYRFTGLAGQGNYTITPAKTSWSFTPVSISTNGLNGDLGGQDFTGVQAAVPQAALDREKVYPNPYIQGKNGRGSKVTIANLPGPSTVRIYDLSGRLLATLPHRQSAAGGSEEWNVSGIASGIYFYVISGDGITPRKGKIGIVK